MEPVSDFDFYLKCARPLVLALPNIPDRALAAAWLRKLIEQTDDKIKLDYIKLLLFVLQRQRLVEPFAQHPNEIEVLEEFPEGNNLVEVAKRILKKDAEDRERKRRSKSPSGDYPSYQCDFSADLREYTAVQNINNFGVHGYFAISKSPLPQWWRVDKQTLPKAARSMIEVSPQPDTITGTLSSPNINAVNEGGDPPPILDYYPEGGRPQPTEEQPAATPAAEEAQEEGGEVAGEGGEEADEAPPPPQPVTPETPKKKRRSPGPPAKPLGKTPTKEDREPPSWGSNLLEVKGILNQDVLNEEIDLLYLSLPKSKSPKSSESSVPTDEKTGAKRKAGLKQPGTVFDDHTKASGAAAKLQGSRSAKYGQSTLKVPNQKTVPSPPRQSSPIMDKTEVAAEYGLNLSDLKSISMPDSDDYQLDLTGEEDNLDDFQLDESKNSYQDFLDQLEEEIKNDIDLYVDSLKSEGSKKSRSPSPAEDEIDKEIDMYLDALSQSPPPLPSPRKSGSPSPPKSRSPSPPKSRSPSPYKSRSPSPVPYYEAEDEEIEQTIYGIPKRHDVPVQLDESIHISEEAKKILDQSAKVSKSRTPSPTRKSPIPPRSKSPKTEQERIEKIYESLKPTKRPITPEERVAMYQTKKTDKKDSDMVQAYNRMAEIAVAMGADEKDERDAEDRAEIEMKRNLEMANVDSLGDIAQLEAVPQEQQGGRGQAEAARQYAPPSAQRRELSPQLAKMEQAAQILLQPPSPHFLDDTQEFEEFEMQLTPDADETKRSEPKQETPEMLSRRAAMLSVQEKSAKAYNKLQDEIEYEERYGRPITLDDTFEFEEKEAEVAREELDGRSPVDKIQVTPIKRKKRTASSIQEAEQRELERLNAEIQIDDYYAQPGARTPPGLSRDPKIRQVARRYAKDPAIEDVQWVDASAYLKESEYIPNLDDIPVRRTMAIPSQSILDEAMLPSEDVTAYQQLNLIKEQLTSVNPSILEGVPCTTPKPSPSPRRRAAASTARLLLTPSQRKRGILEASPPALTGASPLASPEPLTDIYGLPTVFKADDSISPYLTPKRAATPPRQQQLVAVPQALAAARFSEQSPRTPTSPRRPPSPPRTPKRKPPKTPADDSTESAETSPRTPTSPRKPPSPPRTPKRIPPKTPEDESAESPEPSPRTPTMQRKSPSTPWAPKRPFSPTPADYKPPFPPLNMPQFVPPPPEPAVVWDYQSPEALPDPQLQGVGHAFYTPEAISPPMVNPRYQMQDIYENLFGTTNPQLTPTMFDQAASPMQFESPPEWGYVDPEEGLSPPINIWEMRGLVSLQDKQPYSRPVRAWSQPPALGDVREIPEGISPGEYEAIQAASPIERRPMELTVGPTTSVGLERHSQAPALSPIEEFYDIEYEPDLNEAFIFEQDDIGDENLAYLDELPEFAPADVSPMISPEIEREPFYQTVRTHTKLDYKKPRQRSRPPQVGQIREVNEEIAAGDDEYQQMYSDIMKGAIRPPARQTRIQSGSRVVNLGRRAPNLEDVAEHVVLDPTPPRAVSPERSGRRRELLKQRKLNFNQPEDSPPPPLANVIDMEAAASPQQDLFDATLAQADAMMMDDVEMPAYVAFADEGEIRTPEQLPEFQFSPPSPEQSPGFRFAPPPMYSPERTPSPQQQQQVDMHTPPPIGRRMPARPPGRPRRPRERMPDESPVGRDAGPPQRKRGIAMRKEIKKRTLEYAAPGSPEEHRIQSEDLEVVVEDDDRRRPAPLRMVSPERTPVVSPSTPKNQRFAPPDPQRPFQLRGSPIFAPQTEDGGTPRLVSLGEEEPPEFAVTPEDSPQPPPDIRPTYPIYRVPKSPKYPGRAQTRGLRTDLDTKYKHMFNDPVTRLRDLQEYKTEEYIAAARDDAEREAEAERAAWEAQHFTALDTSIPQGLPSPMSPMVRPYDYQTPPHLVHEDYSFHPTPDDPERRIYPPGSAPSPQFAQYLQPQLPSMEQVMAGAAVGGIMEEGIDLRSPTSSPEFQGLQGVMQFDVEPLGAPPARPRTPEQPRAAPQQQMAVATQERPKPQKRQIPAKRSGLRPPGGKKAPAKPKPDSDMAVEYRQNLTDYNVLPPPPQTSNQTDLDVDALAAIGFSAQDIELLRKTHGKIEVKRPTTPGPIVEHVVTRVGQLEMVEEPEGAQEREQVYRRAQQQYESLADEQMPDFAPSTEAVNWWNSKTGKSPKVIQKPIEILIDDGEEQPAPRPQRPPSRPAPAPPLPTAGTRSVTIRTPSPAGSPIPIQDEYSPGEMDFKWMD